MSVQYYLSYRTTHHQIPFFLSDIFEILSVAFLELHPDFIPAKNQNNIPATI